MPQTANATDPHRQRRRRVLHRQSIATEVIGRGENRHALAAAFPEVRLVERCQLRDDLPGDGTGRVPVEDLLDFPAEVAIENAVGTSFRLAEVRRKVESFNKASELIIDKVRKEKSVSLDLKRFVGEVDLEESNGDAVLRFPVKLDQTEGSVKPHEVLRGILGRQEPDASFMREKLHFASEAGVSLDPRPS